MFLELNGLSYGMGLIAIIALSISGALDVARKKISIFSSIFVGFITGLCGGTLFDVILGNFPVFWVHDPWLIVLCVIASGMMFLLSTIFEPLVRTQVWVDAIGIALLSVVGTASASALGWSEPVAVSLGVIVALFGGVVRDIISSRRINVITEAWYVSTIVVGSLSYLGLGLLDLPENFCLISGALIAFTMRGFSIARQRNKSEHYLC